MGVNFVPTLDGYTGQGAFRFWCQKVLPLVYDDSLSYYELLNKVVDYLNNAVEDVSVLGSAFTELVEYLNDISFSDEVSEKLDQMVLDGDLDNTIAVAVNAWMDSNVASGTTIAVDKSLTIPDAAADAFITGNEIKSLKSNKIPFPDAPASKFGNNGQVLTTNGDGSTAWAGYGKPTDSQTAEALSNYIADHPEIVSTIQDGSLTIDKFVQSQAPYITPEMFGAVGNGVTDDSEAFQAAFTVGGYVRCAKDKVYALDSGVVVYKNTTLDLNGSTLVQTSGSSRAFLIQNFEDTDEYTEYSGNGNIKIKNGKIDGGHLLFWHGENIAITNVNFTDCKSVHFIEISSCKNVVIRNCSFIGNISSIGGRYEYVNIDPCTRTSFPWVTNVNSPMYDYTVVDGVTVESCIFDAGDSTMDDAIGKHSLYDSESPTSNQAKNIFINNCKVKSANNSGFYFNGVRDSQIVNCTVENSGAMVWLYYCDSVIVNNCSSYNESVFSIFSNTNKGKFSNNVITKPVDGDTWGLSFRGACDSCEYSNNFFSQNATSIRRPLVFTNATVTNFVCVGNSCKSARLGDTPITLPTNSTIGFAYCDKVSLTQQINTQEAAINSGMGMTQFNKIIVKLGSLTNRTLREIELPAFTFNGMAIGSVYPFYLNTSYEQEFDVVVLTVLSDTTLSLTAPQTVQIREVFGCKC